MVLNWLLPPAPVPGTYGKGPDIWLPAGAAPENVFVQTERPLVRGVFNQSEELLVRGVINQSDGLFVPGVINQSEELLVPGVINHSVSLLVLGVINQPDEAVFSIVSADTICTMGTSANMSMTAM